MNRDEITLFINIFYCQHMFYFCRNIPCCIDRQIRIITKHIHAQCYRRIGNLHTDGSKSDDTKFFPFDFSSCKCFFCFFSSFCNSCIFFVLFYPVDTACDITTCKKHTGNHQLFYTVCICTWCIEYDDSLLCAFIQRDIVDTCTCTGYGQQWFGKFHIMHSCTAHQCNFCRIEIICFLISIRE